MPTEEKTNNFENLPSRIVDHPKSDQVAYYLGRVGYDPNVQNKRIKWAQRGIVRAAADACGISTVSVYEWLKSPEFCSRISSVRTRIGSECLDIIQTTLRSLIGRDAIEAACRLGEIVMPEQFNRQVVLELYRHQHRLELIEQEQLSHQQAIAELPQPMFVAVGAPEFPPAKTRAIED